MELLPFQKLRDNLCNQSRMRRKRGRNVSSDEIGLQIAPMIDVTMLLLFFFMLSTTLKNTQASPPITVPSTKHFSEAAPRKNAILVVVSKNGEILINGKVSNALALPLELTRQARSTENSQPVAEIHADASTDGATIKRIVSAVSESGIGEVSYAVRNN